MLHERLSRLLALLIFSTGIFPLYGQNCHEVITGIVMDMDNQPLPGATVFIVSLKKGTVTSQEGYFELNQLCAGSFILLVRYTGYRDTLVKMNVPTMEKLQVQLMHGETLLQDVLIEDRFLQRGRTQSLDLLTVRDLDALHGKPLGESLKRVAGVSVIQTGPAIFKPVIHGLHSQRILILNNGIRQEGQQWGSDHAPEIDPSMASEIEVVKGAEAVRYGADALGGVIIVSPPSLHANDEFGGEINMDFMSNNRMGAFSGMLEGTMPGKRILNWRAQTTLKRGGDFSSPDYTLSNTGLLEFNFSAAVGYDAGTHGMEFFLSSFNTEIGILRTAHAGNLDDIQSSIESGRPWYVKDFTYNILNPKQQINHHLLKMKVYRNIKNLGRLTFLYGGQLNQRKEFDIRRGGRDNRPSLSLNLLSNVIDISLDHEEKRHSGSIGINGTFKNNNNVPGTGVRPIIPNYDQYAAGIFFIEKLKKNKWLFEAGLRYDFQFLRVLTFDPGNNLLKPTFQFNYFSGNFGAAFNASQNVRITSNVGISTRPPHVSELYSEGLHHSSAFIVEGIMRTEGGVLTEQEIINKEVSTKWITTLLVAKEKFNLEASGYYNIINNYVFTRPVDTRLTIRGHFPLFHYDQTDALLLGTDIKFSWQITKKLLYQGKGAYIYAKDLSRSDVLIFIPPAYFENELAFELGSVGKAEKAFLSVGVPMTARQNRAPMVIYPKDAPDYSGDEVFDFAPAPDAYTLLNVSMGFQLPVREKRLSVILTCENLLNHGYRNYMNRLRYFADETGRNISVRVKYEFHSH